MQSYFSLDAKLLGTVTLKQLMWLLGITSDSIPVLKEVLEFGTAVDEAVDKAGGDLANDVRTRVLAPLRGVIVRLGDEWGKLDEVVRGKQVNFVSDSQTNVIGLSDLYPELDSGPHKGQGGAGRRCSNGRRGLHSFPNSRRFTVRGCEFVRQLQQILLPIPSDDLKRPSSAMCDSRLPI